MNSIELIWQMGLASLNETDNELRLPPIVSDNLSNDEVAFLEARLSDHLNGVPTISFKDLDMNVYRVLRMPDMQKNGGSSATSPESTMSAASTSSASPKIKAYNTGLRVEGKKSKIPRPPNAFILYRQKHHPLVKAQNPDLKNNDISVILGGQWKAETLETRNKFKAIAEELKRQHLLKHPGYQYSPRKPSEKKRRMTAKKVAKLQADLLATEVSDFPSLAIVDIPDMEFEMVDSDVLNRNATTQASFENTPSMEATLGFGYLAPNPFQSSDAMAGELNTIFPPGQPLPVPAPPPAPLPAAMFQNPALPVSRPTQFSPSMNAFFNSLIDWDAINRDWERVKACMDPEQASLSVSSTPAFRPNEEEGLDYEFNATMKLWE